jgi:hypothetical protein
MTTLAFLGVATVCEDASGHGGGSSFGSSQSPPASTVGGVPSFGTAVVGVAA